MHELEYSLTFLGLADDRRAAFFIVLVGNQMEYVRARDGLFACAGSMHTTQFRSPC